MPAAKPATPHAAPRGRRGQTARRSTHSPARPDSGAAGRRDPTQVSAAKPLSAPHPKALRPPAGRRDAAQIPSAPKKSGMAWFFTVPIQKSTFAFATISTQPIQPTSSDPD